VVGQDATAHDLVVLSTRSPAGQLHPSCPGSLGLEHGASCADARLVVRPAAGDGDGIGSAAWVLHRTPGGAFTLRYGDGAEGCALYLTAAPACDGAAPSVAPADGSALQEWALEAAPTAQPHAG
jgi:hypothetical protein